MELLRWKLRASALAFRCSSSLGGTRAQRTLSTALGPADTSDRIVSLPSQVPMIKGEPGTEPQGCV